MYKKFGQRSGFAQIVALLPILFAAQAIAAPKDDGPIKVQEGGSISGFNVLENDKNKDDDDDDDDDDELVAIKVTDPEHGVATLSLFGTLTYTHDGSETRSDSFTYRNDFQGGPTATVFFDIEPVNDAPQITGQSPDPLQGTEDQAFDIQLSYLQVVDPDNDFPDDFSLQVLPGDGYSMQGSTVTPEENRDGPLTVNVRVSDGEDESNVFPFRVQLASVNDPPVRVGSIPPQTVEEDQSFNFDVSDFFEDIDSDLRFDADGLPPNLSINPDSGVISGTPRAADVGVHTVTITARETTPPGPFESASGNFTLTVLKSNTPPRLVSAIPDQEAFEGEPFSFNVTPHFDDDDLDRGDVLTFSASGLPAGLGINATSGVISGTPSAAVVREQPYQVRVTATDSENETASDTFALTVQTRNTPPELETPIPDQQAVESEPFSLDASNHFVDSDEGDVLTFSASGLPASLSIDEASGLISGTPTTAEARDAPYQVTVTATDERGETASDTFALTVVLRDRANLALEVEATPSPALLTDSLTLRFTTSNDGPSPAPESGFEADVIGSELALTPAAGSNCVTAAIEGGQRLTCTLGQLDPGASRTVTVELSTGAAGDVAIFAEAGVAGAEPIDPTPSDNQVRVSVGIAEAFSGGALRMLGPASVLSLAAGDLDGDGNVDIVAGTELGEPLRIWFGAGDRDFGQPLDLPVQSATTGVAVADLDGDGDLDLVVVTAGGDQNRVYLNGGSRDFAAGASLGSDDARGVVIADFDGDAAPDIAIASAASDSVWINRGGGNFDLALQFPPRESDGIAAGVVVGDALPDLVVASRTGPDLFHRNLSRTGSISFAPPVEVNDGASAGVAIGDVDGDGRPDLVFAAVPAEFRDLAANPVLRSTGQGTFASLAALGAAPTTAVGIADIDGGGPADILFVSETGAHQVWRGTSGTPALQPQQIALPGATTLLLADLDDDGATDVVLGSPDGAGVDIYFNDGTGNVGGGDSEPPVITLNGESTVTVPFGGEWNDPGATATDNVDGDLSDAVEVSGSVSTSLVGAYRLTYTVTDSAGNQASVVRTVNVAPAAGTGGGGGSAGPGLLALASALLLGRALRRRPRRWNIGGGQSEGIAE